jgi:hypothetical protein
MVLWRWMVSGRIFKDPSPHAFTTWAQPDQRLPRIFNPKVRGQASLTSYGWPATWTTLQLTPALPDLSTALSRRLAPVIQPFNAGAPPSTAIPAVFVPIRSTGYVR